MTAGASRSFLGVDASLGGHRWISRLDERGAETAVAIAQHHGVPDIVARVLAGRDVTVDAVEGFLNPTLRELMPDPAVITDLEVAAGRLVAAVEARETVAIFGDYDVDGAASAALMHRFLSSLGLAPRIYIPDRIFEGYGPNVEAMRKLAESGATLIVAVDCGSASFEALEEAERLGLDVVVLDHHETGDRLPPAAAIANPNRQDDLSGLGYLAAVGVVYMTLVATHRRLREKGWYEGRSVPDLLQWADLVALGTVCDVVPLVGLNRALVTKGLVVMARRGNRGLAALADSAGLTGPLSPYHLGFVLGPRINAGGRIGDATLGATLLSTDDAAQAGDIATTLERLNGERRAIETEMLERAVAEADREIGDGEGPPVLVSAQEGWHPGVVGLIASRLKDRFKRPAVAIALQMNGQGTGSGRSIPGFDIGRAMRDAVDEGLLLKGGGHPMAAGLTVTADRLGDLRAFLERRFAATSTLPDRHDLLVDGAVTARGASIDLIEALETAGPYGAGHPEPLVVLPGHRLAFVEEHAAGHVRARLASSDGAVLSGVAFRAVGTDLGAALARGRGRLFHVAGHLTIDRWRDRTTAQLRIRDAAIAD